MKWLILGPEIYFLAVALVFLILSMTRSNGRRDFSAALLLAGLGVAVTLKSEADPALLARLKEKGITRAISTNRTTSMKHVMEAYGLYPYFDMVVTALDVQNPKPHPESVEKILKMFGLNREGVLFVGDSDVDRKTARSSGVKFIAYKNEDLEADGFIADHLNLLAFLSNGD